MRILLATVALLVALPGAAYAADVLINNGDDCSNPDNVINHDTYQYDFVFVRNVGCGTPDPGSPCPSPGAATEVCVVDGGDVLALFVYDSSTFTMSGGTVDALSAYESSIVTMSGGMVGNWDGVYADDSSTVRISGGVLEDYLWAVGSSTITISGGLVQVVEAHDSSTITIDGGELWTVWVWSKSLMSGGTVGLLGPHGSSIVTISGGRVTLLDAYLFSTVTFSGGTVEGRLQARYSSTITIAGCDFAVDGSPVPYGDLTAETGTLTGKLASGEPIDNVFYQGGYGDVYTGTITLVEGRLFPALSSWGKLALAASLLGAGSLGVGVMRRRAG